MSYQTCPKCGAEGTGLHGLLRGFRDLHPLFDCGTAVEPFYRVKQKQPDACRIRELEKQKSAGYEAISKMSGKMREMKDRIAELERRLAEATQTIGFRDETIAELDRRLTEAEGVILRNCDPYQMSNDDAIVVIKLQRAAASKGTPP